MSSRLGSLFGMNSGEEDSSASLKYSAPKEPKKGGSKQKEVAGTSSTPSASKGENTSATAGGTYK